MSAKVSVIMPAFNAAPFIAAAIQSVLDQTHDNVEVIVIDDGSTDGTFEIAGGFGSRVRVIRQRQRGAASARNTGAAQASGEWLAFLDADDLWEPEKLSRQLAAAGPDIHMIYSDRFNIGSVEGWPAIQGSVQPPYEGDVFVPLLRTGNVITTSTVLMRTAVFKELGGFCEDPAVLPAEDWDLWIRFAEQHGVRVCREPLVSYRLHPDGVSRNVARMNAARRTVVARALRLPRGRTLDRRMKRRILAQTWLTNGWDARRHGATAKAAVAYACAIARTPFQATAYRELAKLAIGRH